MPKSKHTLLVELPYFPGFYDSWFSQAIDDEQEQWCEWSATDDNDRDDAECRWPEPMRLTADELSDCFYESTSYAKAYDMLAREWARCFDIYAEEAFGFPVHIAWESMVSPREYNFETDRVYAHIPLSVCRRLFALSRRDGHAELARVIEQRCTSRSGFCSYYSNCLDDWLSKPLAQWDHNELLILLMAALQCVDIYETASPGGEGARMDLIEQTLDQNYAYTAWESAVDWTRFDHARAVLRDDKRIEWEAANPGQHLPAPVFRDARQGQMPLAAIPQPGV